MYRDPLPFLGSLGCLPVLGYLRCLPVAQSLIQSWVPRLHSGRCIVHFFSSYGYASFSSFLLQSLRFFLVTTCSPHASTQYFALNSRMKRGSLQGGVRPATASAIARDIGTCDNLTDHSSLAMPRSLQHRIKALLLHPSVAVGTPLGSKYSCSPRATETKRPRQTRPYSREMILLPTFVSPRGARPHPPGPNDLFSIRRYLISGR